MIDLSELKQQAQTIKNATIVGENTATRVGSLFEDIVNEEEIRTSVEDGAVEDLGIYDDEYNAICVFENGHTRTKKWKSKVTPQTDSNTMSDLEIVDEKNNVILRVEKGNIYTKYFSSVIPQVGTPLLYAPVYIDSSPSLMGGVNDVYAAYESLATTYPSFFMSNGVIGMDSSGTYEVRHYTLGFKLARVSTNRNASDPNLWSDETYKRKRLLITSGCHPTEQPSILGCYQAISEILSSNEPWAMFIKSNYILDIVPLINPWGLAQTPATDNNANGENVNRTYYTDVQQENTNIINLIAELKPKGLVGVIDCHNGAYYDNDGYFVSKPSYPEWNFYVTMSQQLSAAADYLFQAVFGGVKNHFHVWDASANSGQLHEYANNNGLLGCTFEVRNKLTLGGALYSKGAQLTKMLLINLINAFGTH